jgi:CheY-like chemotaxis protein
MSQARDRRIDAVLESMILCHRPAQVLLADDDPEMREVIAAPLREDGYTVVEAGDGIELIRAVQRFEASLLPVGVIVTDVRMPGFSGLEMLEYLQYAGIGVPAILITGFGDARTRAQARSLGADMVLDKPFDVDALRAAVARIVPPL